MSSILFSNYGFKSYLICFDVDMAINNLKIIFINCTMTLFPHLFANYLAQLFLESLYCGYKLESFLESFLAGPQVNVS